MEKTIHKTLIPLAFLLCLLLALAECTYTPDHNSSHSFGTLVAGVDAGFLRDGHIAYYQCKECGKLFDEQKKEVDTVALPRLSPELSLCVNGSALPLVCSGSGDTRITWTLDGLTLTEGDVITVCSSAEPRTVYAYSGEGNIGEAGRVLASALDASVTLTAGKEGLTLSVSSGKYPGTVLDVNGTQHPLWEGTQYAYGCARFDTGDTFTVVDNISGTVHGFGDPAPSDTGNVYDYHRDESGAFVIDRAGCYLLRFERENKTISLTKIFPPLDTDALNLVFSGESRSRVAMEEVQLPKSSGEFDEFLLQTDTAISTDIASHITANSRKVYSAVLVLEAGEQFLLESTDSQKLTGQRLTQVKGPSGCVQTDGYFITVTQPGTYFVSYTPAFGSISVTQLSAGGLSDAAKLLDRKIAALPSGLELTYASGIKALYAEYLHQRGSLGHLLKASAKLEAMYEAVQALEADPPRITYHVSTPSTNHVYRSKEALRDAFFTDLYYYILVYHGEARLRSFGIKNAGDFLDMAKDFNGGGVTDLYGIGYASGNFLLVGRRNGILENQTDRGFFGFCWENGMYREILPFFIRYFAYWRIDEGYANQSNPGADIFAEAWAPTVDIAKFFYYDSQTSYVKTERVLDCFTNTAGVVYGLDEAGPLPSIRLRGYIFEGWYDNPNYTGAPITEADLGTDPIVLYAKWTPDTAQQDRDSAALVDVYIHNLTTAAAIVTEETVGYVHSMYDALTESGKSLVENYAELAAFPFQPKR